MTRAALLLAACALALACGAPGTPEETARAFLARVGRDPIGTLPLLSEDFHGRHALRHTMPGASETLLSRYAAPLPAEPAARRRELAAARLGWLILQRQETSRAHANVVGLERLEEALDGDRARVAFRIRLLDAPGFVQRFALVREGPGARWQIDAIEQEGVGAANVASAFALAPSTELLRRAAEWQGQGRRR